MKAHLLHSDRDFDWKWALSAAAEREAAHGGRRFTREPNFDPKSGLPWNTEALIADLALNTVFNAMADDDDYVFEVARKVILAAEKSDLDTIRYRQDVLQDCLDHPALVRELYALAIEAMEKQKRRYSFGILSRSPGSILQDGIETMATFLDFLKKLRRFADSHAHQFFSKGWSTFFAMVKHDLDEEYFELVQHHMEQLKFRHGELLSAALGKANKGSNYVLHKVAYSKRWWEWWTRLFEEKGQVYAFELHPRDEAGARALDTLRNRGIAPAANALGQSADHVRNFFAMLRVELAFYIGCLNLRDRLAHKAEPICMPAVSMAEEQQLSFRGLYDVGLTLSIDQRVVGNDTDADGKALLIITGPNTGGKSTFLRSVGLAQLMMQSGMFAPAEAFSASLCDGLSTHFKREEDAGMKSGKFDEEMSRVSEIVDHLASRTMILFNESFAATNEREGSEIGQQIVSALLEDKARVLFVTHMYELANGFHERNRKDALFLRAARQTDGTRTYKLTEGEPLPTSFGEDLYYRIFAEQRRSPSTSDEEARAAAT